MDKSDYEILASTNYEGQKDDSNVIEEVGFYEDIAIYGMGFIDIDFDDKGKVIVNRIDPLEIINELKIPTG